VEYGRIDRGEEMKVESDDVGFPTAPLVIKVYRRYKVTLNVFAIESAATGYERQMSR